MWTKPQWHLNSLSNTTSRFHVTDTTGCVEWLEQAALLPARTPLHSLRLVTRALTLSLRWEVKTGFWQTAFLCFFPPFLYKKRVFISGFVGSGRCCCHVIGTVRSVSGKLLFGISSVWAVRLGKSRCLYRAHVRLRHKVQSSAAHILHLSSPSKQRTGWWAIIPLRVIFSSIFHPVTIPHAECSYFPPTHHTSSKAFFLHFFDCNESVRVAVDLYVIPLRCALCSNDRLFYIP